MTRVPQKEACNTNIAHILHVDVNRVATCIIDILSYLDARINTDVNLMHVEAFCILFQSDILA